MSDPSVMDKPYLSRDAYLLVAEQADDRTLLEMLSVNKNYHNEALFERIIKKRYPLLVRRKKKEESWKKFYIRMIYYLSSLVEQGLPYIPHPDFNPENLFISRSDKNFLMDTGLYYSAAVGDMNLVRHFINLGATNFDNAMASAAKGGYTDIVKYVTDLGATDFNRAMVGAAEGGQTNVVEYLKSLKDKHI